MRKNEANHPAYSSYAAFSLLLIYNIFATQPGVANLISIDLE